jgi:hypothetical protein
LLLDSLESIKLYRQKLGDTFSSFFRIESIWQVFSELFLLFEALLWVDLEGDGFLLIVLSVELSDMLFIPLAESAVRIFSVG